MPKWILYGRVKMLKTNIRRRSAKEKVFVTITYWLPHEAPVYAVGSHLKYETKEAIYRIYNPLRIAFDVSQLVSHVRTIHAKMDDPVLSWEIVEIE